MGGSESKPSSDVALTRAAGLVAAASPVAGAVAGAIIVSIYYKLLN